MRLGLRPLALGGGFIVSAQSLKHFLGKGLEKTNERIDQKHQLRSIYSDRSERDTF